MNIRDPLHPSLFPNSKSHSWSPTLQSINDLFGVSNNIPNNIYTILTKKNIIGELDGFTKYLLHANFIIKYD